MPILTVVVDFGGFSFVYDHNVREFVLIMGQS